MSSEVLEFCQKGKDGDLIPWPVQTQASERFGLSIAEVEAVLLKNDLLPARYQRNRTMFSTSQQLQLFQSRVAVVGCGGLGGYIIEGLTRLGIGHLILIDPDTFEEHNLNRQLLSSPASLGVSKVDAGKKRVALVNPAVTVTSIQEAFSADNGRRILGEADIVVDALDSIETRLQLETVCKELNVPLVHGAIAGWFGHVSTIFPGDDTIRKNYDACSAAKGVEKNLGNPSFTPAVIASLEVAEVCKVLLREGETLHNRMLSIDLREMDFEQIHW